MNLDKINRSAIKTSSRIVRPRSWWRQNREVFMKIGFRNISGAPLENIAVAIILPPEVEIVDNQIMVVSRDKPEGVMLSYGASSTCMDLGGYPPINAKGRGVGVLIYRARLDLKTLTEGANTLDILHDFTGHKIGGVPTKKSREYTNIRVTKQQGIVSSRYIIHYDK
ncbi:hypothetical protein FWC63_01090 [Candidatus Saccharibacteria bacterium]|nr:hypothetical protein [Candidatus Saccharibacteria bacterium]